ncbi:MAG: hypothetical protein EHM23_19755 [Acidobacteria bacterium]|nr:MAG: hypothetical protein EHM23_19755 [Acidobacteriota bacterium]
MWTKKTAFSCPVLLFVLTVWSASAPASLPVPLAGNSVACESRQALKAVAGYYDSDDGACRLPVPSGFCIKSRLVEGGRIYDPVANRIIRRPNEELRDFCLGTKTIAVVQQLRAAVFPRQSAAPESALGRVASDYLRREVLEDGRYFPVLPDDVSRTNGISRVRTLLKNGYGRDKQLSYYVEYLRPESGPVLVLTVKERGPDVSTTYHGLVAKCFGDKIVAGYARFLLTDEVVGNEAEMVRAAIAGIQVKDLPTNGQLEKAVVGTWETSRQPGRGTYADARYVFGPDGRFAMTSNVLGKTAGRAASEPGDYRIFGNVIALRYDKDEVTSYPVKLEGSVLRLGKQAYVRVR